MSSIVDALSLLTPFDIDKPKIRLGPNGDGGYVFVDDLSPDQTVMSYGIGAECRLDLEFAQRGHQVFMFDHTIDGIDIPHPGMHFFREGIAGETSDTGRVYTIADSLIRHEIDGQNLIVKLDVEGAEFEALTSAPDEIIARFAQLVIEVHHLDRLAEPSYRERFSEMFQKINRHCTLFHVHANNFDGPDTFYIVGGIPVPRIIELSYVRTTAVTRRPSRTLYPTSLDFPNTAQRDKLLWMFPFLPNTISREEFTDSAVRTEKGWEHPVNVQSTASGSEWREQLELKEAELQRIFAAGVGWRQQLEEKEAELQRVTALAAALRERLEGIRPASGSGLAP